MKDLFFLGALLLLLFSSCREPEDSTSVIARVGRATLTDSLLDKAVGDHVSDEIRLRYVKEWVDVELLAQAARAEKMHREADIKSQLVAMERSLLASKFLEKYAGTVGAYGNSTKELQEYHANNQDAYLRTTPVIKLAKIAFPTVKEAWQVYKGLTVEKFREIAIEQSGSETTYEKGVVFKPYDRVDTSVVEYLFSIDAGRLSLPRKVGGSAYIFFVVDKAQEGTPATFQEVADQVAIDAAVRKYQDSLKTIKDQLRQSVDYYYNEKVVTLSKWDGVDSQEVVEVEE